MNLDIWDTNSYASYDLLSFCYAWVLWLNYELRGPCDPTIIHESFTLWILGAAILSNLTFGGSGFYVGYDFDDLGPLLLTWFNFYPSMDKWLHSF